MSVQLVIIVLYFALTVPARMAVANKKEKADLARIRIASLMFGWTVVGWLWALYMAFAGRPAIE